MTPPRYRNVLMTLWRHATGVPMVIAVLLALMVMISLGTIAQAHMPLVVAQQLYFNSLVFWAGGWLPLPGGGLLLMYLAFSLTVQMVRQPFSSSSAGSWLTHAGVLLLIVSGLVANYAMQSGYVVGTTGVATRLWQEEGLTETAPPSAWPVLGFLPFTITVDEFIHRDHPGTNIPAYFASRLTIVPDGGQPWHTAVRMNEPVRLMGYTIYQASYIKPEQGAPISILAVVKDDSRLLPYLATGVIGLGLLMHILLRQRRFWKRTLAAVLLVGAMAAPVAQAQDNGWTAARLDVLAHLPVQHQGRVKPLLTVASTVVPFVTGEQAPLDEEMALLAQWLFNPGMLTSTPLLTLDGALIQELGVAPKAAYTVTELVEALMPRQAELQALEQVPAAKLSGPQAKLMQVQERVEVVLSVARTFALLQPLMEVKEPLAAKLGVAEGFVNAAQVLEHREMLVELAKQKDAQALELVMQLRMRQPEQPNGLLRLVVPPPQDTNAWASPWLAARSTLAGDQAKAFGLWQTLVMAQPVVADEVLAGLRDVGALHTNRYALAIEVFTLRYPLVSLSVLPMLVGLLALAAPKRWRMRRVVTLGALGGLALLSLGIAARMYILSRPPVATLYESVIFVAWGSVLLGLLFRKSSSALLPAALASGVGLVMVSHGLTQGTDTMGMLMAVLNTNFWLATHVLTITGGYAASILVGGVALWAQVQRTIIRSGTTAQAKTHTVLRHLSVVALLLVAVGTLLGGIWASQSWGRFWGWDPKENGALVLTLWLAVCAHIRLLKPFPVAEWLAVSALTPVVVALSWFGVNLLSVGLHSYGFTDQMAGGLTVFCSAAVMVVGSLWVLDKVFQTKEPQA